MNDLSIPTVQESLAELVRLVRRIAEAVEADVEREEPLVAVQWVKPPETSAVRPGGSE